MLYAVFASSVFTELLCPTFWLALSHQAVLAAPKRLLVVAFRTIRVNVCVPPNPKLFSVPKVNFVVVQYIQELEWFVSWCAVGLCTNQVVGISLVGFPLLPEVAYAWL